MALRDAALLCYTLLFASAMMPYADYAAARVYVAATWRATPYARAIAYAADSLLIFILHTADAAGALRCRFRFFMLFMPADVL